MAVSASEGPDASILVSRKFPLALEPLQGSSDVVVVRFQLEEVPVDLDRCVIVPELHIVHAEYLRGKGGGRVQLYVQLGDLHRFAAEPHEYSKL